MPDKKNESELPECCKPKARKGLVGVLYGLIPHAGCIAFIISSMLGLTFAASIFRPLLASSILFYAMITMSLFFAMITAFIYMKKDISFQNIKNHKGYLGILFGTTIGVSLILYFLIFPAIAAASNSSAITSSNSSIQGLSTITLNVAIPCEGHVPLITGDLKTLSGVNDVKYTGNFNFVVYYDSSKISKQDILNLAIFKEYKAKEV